ncbi:MAG: hypothetical protein IJS67_02110 [Clostridia bacterium]|nr:hypothetical protein [Clostridia bacterium]
MPFKKLLESTTAYKIIAADKKNQMLSHAYLIVCDDADSLKTYLKIFAKLIMCEGEEICGKCRSCTLIEKEAYADCAFYPTEGGKILTADIDDMLSQTYIKPLENKYRLFVLCGAENMNAAAQNKILKTLEEPPRGVVILMGATSDYSLLPTIKSRVKRLDIPPFSDKALFDAFSADLKDEKRLKTAISLSFGRAGAVKTDYEGGDAEKISTTAKRVISEMKTSKDVLKFVGEIDKGDVAKFAAALSEEFAEMARLLVKEGRTQTDEGYTLGAIAALQDMIAGKLMALRFNANAAMTTDGILLRVLEEKHKWQKLLG